MAKQVIPAGIFTPARALPALAVAADDWAAIDRALGRVGAEQAGGVHRYGFPRSNLNVTLDGVAIKPALDSRPKSGGMINLGAGLIITSNRSLSLAF